MEKDLIIVVAEDDEGHAILIKKNLRKAGIVNRFIHLKDGQEVIDYFYKNNYYPDKSYLLLLDLRMPKVTGEEALEILKRDKIFKKIPVVILTTNDDPIDVEKCHLLGCNTYIVKPIDYDKFAKVLLQLGFYFKIIETPRIEEKTDV